jgi:hypothetical protein
MVIDVIVRMAEAELETLEKIYEDATSRKLLALKFGTKAEANKIQAEANLAWARYDQLSTFITNVKYEYERVGA